MTTKAEATDPFGLLATGIDEEDVLRQTFPWPPMKKEQIVEVLETIATLLELQEENPFKIRAYTNAARSIETWGGNLRELAQENRLEEIPGVGKAIAGKINELALTGSSKFFDELRSKFPARILELFSLSGLGAKKIKALYEKLQVGSIADLPGLVMPGGSRSCQASARRRRISSPERSRIARNTPAVSSSARSRPKLNSCRTICARIRGLPGQHRGKLSAAEGDRARSRFHRRDDGHRQRSLNFLSGIRWSRASSRAARPKPACGCAPAFKPICAW